MDVDPYRLAYNVFHSNWQKFGIPIADIPPPKTEKVPSLDLLVPGFSIAVLLFQIASRKELKTFLNNECQTAHNLRDIYTRFRNIMKVALPMVDKSNDSMKKGVSENTSSEDVSQDTVEEFLSEKSMEIDPSENIEYRTNDDLKDLPKVIVKECIFEDDMKGLPEGAMKEGLLEDAMKEDLSGNSMKESLPENKSRSEDIPGLIAYSLAVCAELILYEKDNENNKYYMKSMPDIWTKYFNKHLKPLCIDAQCTQDDLQVYSNNIKCPEKFLNKFISENKNEGIDIADKFLDYTAKNCADGSPEHSKLITEGRRFSTGISFLKIKEKFTKFKEICNCVTSRPIDEIPLLSDYSPDFNSSSSTTPST